MSTAVAPNRPGNHESDLAQLPVASYRDAVEYLRRPFTASAVRYKVQAQTPKGNRPTRALVVCYIDARLVIERLNLVCPHLWSDAYEPTAKAMWCHLTVDGITRHDVGEPGDSPQGSKPKALVSDALKRAAVKFGVGVSLYATPQIWLDMARAEVEQRFAGKDDRGQEKFRLEITARGLQVCQAAYQRWLDEHAVQVFGQPLDHGDVLDAVGDYEGGGESVVPDEDTTFPPADIPVGRGPGSTQPPSDVSQGLREEMAQADAEQQRHADVVRAAAGVPPGRGSDITQPGDDPRQGPHTVEDLVRENAEQRAVEAAAKTQAPGEDRLPDGSKAMGGEVLFEAIKRTGITGEDLTAVLRDLGLTIWPHGTRRDGKVAHLDGFPREQRYALATRLGEIETAQAKAVPAGAATGGPFQPDATP